MRTHTELQRNKSLNLMPIVFSWWACERSAALWITATSRPERQIIAALCSKPLHDYKLHFDQLRKKLAEGILKKN